MRLKYICLECKLEAGIDISHYIGLGLPRETVSKPCRTHAGVGVYEDVKLAAAFVALQESSWMHGLQLGARELNELLLMGPTVVLSLSYGLDYIREVDQRLAAVENSWVTRREAPM